MEADRKPGGDDVSTVISGRNSLMMRSTAFVVVFDVKL
jgi:hypothetical protein